MHKESYNLLALNYELMHAFSPKIVRKFRENLNMVLIVGDDVGWHFQSPGTTSRYGNLTKNTQKIRKNIRKTYKWCWECHVLVSVFIQGPLHIYIQKGKYHLVWPKVKKNNIRRILCLRVHSVECWDDGHMTNYQKWST